MLQSASRYLLAAFFIVIGMIHFTSPDGMLAIVPDYLPNPLLLIYVSGFFEILGGIGLLIPSVQRWAAWGLVALLIAVFPANVNMAMNHRPFFGKVYPDLFCWARLPFQIAFIGWVWTYTRKPVEAKTVEMQPE